MTIEKRRSARFDRPPLRSVSANSMLPGRARLLQKPWVFTFPGSFSQAIQNLKPKKPSLLLRGAKGTEWSSHHNFRQVGLCAVLYDGLGEVSGSIKMDVAAQTQQQCISYIQAKTRKAQDQRVVSNR